jgi:hypothetical protein
MSRLGAGYGKNTSSTNSGLDRRSRSVESVVLAGGKTSAETGHRRLDSAGTERTYGLTADRHDWLVPMELP